MIAAGFALFTPVLIVNSDDYSSVQVLAGETAAMGTPLLALTTTKQADTL